MNLSGLTAVTTAAEMKAWLSANCLSPISPVMTGSDLGIIIQKVMDVTADVPSFAFENGLTNNNGTVELGGTLTGDVVYNQGNYQTKFNFTDNAQNDSFVTIGGGYVEIATNGLTWNNSSSKNVSVGTDYSVFDGVMDFQTYGNGCSTEFVMGVSGTLNTPAIGTFEIIANNSTGTKRFGTTLDIGTNETTTALNKGMIVKDTWDNIGLQYFNDVSTVGKTSPRWIPDWGTVTSYITTAIGGTSPAWSSITGKPITLSGYGITDAYPLTSNPSGFLTGITSAQVTGALGFTPENIANKNIANGYAGLNSSGKLNTSLFPDTILGNLHWGGSFDGNVVTSNSQYPQYNGLTLPAADSTNQGIYFVSTANYTYGGVNYLIGDWIVSYGTSGWSKVENSDAVSLVFGRAGNIVSNSGDYAAFYPSLSGSYVDPSWISSLSWSKITGRPNTLSGYGITDAVDISGTQTITGAKSFSGSVTLAYASGAFKLNTTAKGVLMTHDGAGTVFINSTNPLSGVGNVVLDVSPSIGTPTLVIPTISGGYFYLLGSTSGQISLKAQADSGTYNWNYPTTAGTSGYVLTSAGGGTAPMTWTNLGNYLLSSAAATSYVPYSGATGPVNLGSNTLQSGNIGIGALPVTNIGLLLKQTILNSGGSGQQFSAQGTYDSGITASAVSFYSAPSTSAAAYTILNNFHFRADGTIIGSGSAITNQFGFYVQSSLTTATNNYGFYGNIAAQSNTYNLYMNGTAMNYLNGNLGIGTLPVSGVAINIGSSTALAGVQTTGIINNTSSAGYGFYANNVISSSQTGSVFGFRSTMSTQASTAIGSVVGFTVDGATLGTGATISNQYGFLVQGTFSTAANNYAFYSSLASGTGRYNLYMAGTALNFMAGGLGIGAQPVSTTGLGVGATGTIQIMANGTATGSTTIYGIASQPTIMSDVTSAAYIVRATPTTTAASFTLASLYNFLADGVSLGAGSAITNQYGFIANSGMTAATNNYGFFGNIASGTGRWNLYMGGTAGNYMAGSLGIGTSTLIGKLNLVGGTATVAPVIINAGINLTTPVSGAIENDGSNLYYTDATSVRHKLAPLDAPSFTGAVTIGNGTSNLDYIITNGPNSGASSGGLMGVQNGGVNVITIGNYSRVLGGSYDSTPTITGGTGNKAVLIYPALRLPVYTVGGLPTGQAAGTRAFVSDCSVAPQSFYAATVTGGGSNFASVYYDGTNWRIG
jgi:hypothetical protein